MAKIVYMSLTGQTRKFIERIDGAESIEITKDDFEFEMTEPYILVTPSYEINVLPFVVKTWGKFIRLGNNKELCQGIFGGGNRNFAELFGITGRMISNKFDIPVLHEFEFQGSEYDIEKIEGVLDKIGNKN